MKLVHLADLHLGYRQFSKITPTGRNQREQDVSDTFLSVVDRIISLEPDLILVAGDVFHYAHPSNGAMLDAGNGFERLCRLLPKAEVAVIAGNHDLPRSDRDRCILRILSHTGVQHIAYGGILDVRLKGLLVRMVPEPLSVSGDWDKTPADILLFHGEVEGAVPFQTAHSVPQGRFGLPYQYVALGHYHVRSDLWPFGGYSGSLDYVSTDIWSEARSGVPKGFVEYDLDSQTRTLHSVPTRPVVDLPVLDVAGWPHKRVTEACLAALEFAGVPDGGVVRQMVVNTEKSEWRDADHSGLKEARKRLLAYQLDVRFRTRERNPIAARAKREAIEGVVKTWLLDRPLPEGIDREGFVELGMTYYREAHPEIEVES